MPSDYESGAKKTIDISVKAEKMTAEILRSALQEFMSGKAEKKGRMSYRQLEKKSDSKLDSIEINEENIADFLNTARKYDVDIALKTDRSTEPNTYHVFFSAGKTEDFKRAFTEYVAKSVKAKNRGKFSREELKKEAAKIAENSRKKHKVREKKRELDR